jgi:hypothetical protein
MTFLPSRTSLCCFCCPAYMISIFCHCSSAQQLIHFLCASDSAISWITRQSFNFLRASEVPIQYVNNQAVDSFPACFRLGNTNNSAIVSFPACFLFSICTVPSTTAFAWNGQLFFQAQPRLAEVFCKLLLVGLGPILTIYCLLSRVRLVKLGLV